MADIILTKQTNLSGEEVVTRAIQFFSTEKWRTTTQSPRSATFEGRPPVPWFLLFLVICSFACFVLPGLILYLFFIRPRMRRFQNMTVTADPMNKGTEVTVTFPSHSKRLVERFLAALPEV